MFQTVTADHAISARSFNEPILSLSLSIRVVHALCMMRASNKSTLTL
jgi:hypothetical protein